MQDQKRRLRIRTTLIAQKSHETLDLRKVEACILKVLVVHPDVCSVYDSVEGAVPI